MLGAGDDGGGSYKVRAIFDNAGFVIPGEDVKVAGVKVGAIDSIDVTDDLKAAVVLDITDKGYQDFREDAELHRPAAVADRRAVRGVRAHAGARAGHRSAAARCARSRTGPGEGQYLLPVEHNGKAVDLDLINNIMREPVRQRLSIILSDLGIGVAGRGEDLNDVIRRADPALKEINEVLKILAGQNEVLADLAVDSDTILGPLARERRHVSGATRQRGRGGAGDGRAARRPRGRHRAAAAVPARAQADDGAARRAQRRDDPGADRPRRGRTGHQPHGPRARAVLDRPPSRPWSRSAR